MRFSNELASTMDQGRSVASCRRHRRRPLCKENQGYELSFNTWGQYLSLWDKCTINKNWPIWLEARRPTSQRCGEAAKWISATNTGFAGRFLPTEFRRKFGRGIRGKAGERSRWRRPWVEGRYLQERNCSTAGCSIEFRVLKQGCSPWQSDSRSAGNSAPNNVTMRTSTLK